MIYSEASFGELLFYALFFTDDTILYVKIDTKTPKSKYAQ